MMRLSWQLACCVCQVLLPCTCTSTDACCLLKKAVYIATEVYYNNFNITKYYDKYICSPLRQRTFDDAFLWFYPLKYLNWKLQLRSFEKLQRKKCHEISGAKGRCHQSKWRKRWGKRRVSQCWVSSTTIWARDTAVARRRYHWHAWGHKILTQLMTTVHHVIRPWHQPSPTGGTSGESKLLERG